MTESAILLWKYMHQREQLFGQWYRTDSNEFEQFSELAQLNNDGSFVFTFSTYNLDGGVIEEITEMGEWGLVGDVHFTITKEEIENNQHYLADLTDADNYQAYQVVQLTEALFSYKHLVTKEIFELYRLTTQPNQN